MGGNKETPQLPETIIVDGREFTKDNQPGTFDPIAIPDDLSILENRSYRVTGSDVARYVVWGAHDWEYVASGWVSTTAPSHYARAELQDRGVTVAVDPAPWPGRWGSGTVHSSTVSSLRDGTARIFYGW